MTMAMEDLSAGERAEDEQIMRQCGTTFCKQHSVTLMTCLACTDAEGWAVSDNSDSSG